MALLTLNEHIISQLTEAQKQFEKSIIPLHNYRAIHPPFIGSAIYLKIGNKYFLVTANHVVDELSSNFTIPGTDSSLKNVNFFTDDSPVRDFGFAEIHTPINNYEPIGINDCIKFDNSSHSLLLAFGFPETKVTHYKENVKVVLETFGTLESSSLEYDEAGASRLYNICLRFNPNEIIRKNSTPTKLPFPNGMSGGAVFALRNTLEINSKPKLVGVLTRWNAEKNKTLVATKIEYILAGIQKVFPDINVPSKIIENIAGTINYN